MENRWKVTKNVIGGENYYAVYRKINENGIDHSGNREYATSYITNCEECEKTASELNAKIGK